MKEDFESQKDIKWDSFSKSIVKTIRKFCCKILVEKVSSNFALPYSSMTNKQKIYRTSFIDLLEKKMDFYLELAAYIFKSKNDVLSLPEESDFIKSMYSLKFIPCKDENSTFNSLIKEMLKDVYDILHNQVNLIGIFEIDKYKDQYLQKKKTTHTVAKYCNTLNWYKSNPDEYNDFVINNLDYHSDLIVFEVLGRQIKDVLK